MPLFIAFFLKHWMAFALAGLVSAALIYVEAERLQVSHYKHAYAGCKAGRKADATLYASNLATVRIALDRQNVALAAAANETYRTQAAATRAISKAQEGRKGLVKELARIEAIPAAPDACANIETLRRAYP